MWVTSLVLMQLGCSFPRLATATEVSFSAIVSTVPLFSLPLATTVAVSPVGSPPASADSEATSIGPVFPRGNMVLQKNRLLVACRQSNIFFYEIKQVNEGPLLDCSKVYRSNVTTTYKLVMESDVETKDTTSVLRLPPLSETLGRLAGTMTKLPPHPDVSLWVKQWEKIDSASGDMLPQTPQELVWHVQAEEEACHLSVALQAAADRVGRRYLQSAGLASSAFLCGYTVSTGGWVDRLAGLEAMLDSALLHAPSVLLFQNLDQEFDHDAATSALEQSRFWSLLVSKLGFRGVQRRNRVAPVLVVLATNKPLMAGPLMENLVHVSELGALPDYPYIEYLWGSAKVAPSIEPRPPCSIPIETIQRLMTGRQAHEVVLIQEDFWIERTSLLRDCDDLALLQQLCNSRDEKRRRSGDLGHIPSVHWQDIGGLAHVRKEIMDAIETPLEYPHLFSSGTSGILLYGPPGVGKTLVAKAVATECKLPFISVKGPELLGSYVGESEAQVRATFKNARTLASKNHPPACILFFDELDSLAPRRGGNASGGNVMDRVVATLLTELDHTGDADGAMLFFMGATNRPDLLDPSLLRPGRLDRLVYLGISSDDYSSILTSQMRKLHLSDDIGAISSEVARHLPPNLTGADLSSIVSSASMQAIERLCDIVDADVAEKRTQGSLTWTINDTLEEWSDDDVEPVVTMQDFLNAAASVVPSVSSEEMAKYDGLRQKFGAHS